MENKNYIQKRRKRQRQYLRLRLGILQFLHVPVLNLLWIPIIVGIGFGYEKRDMVFSLFDVPDFIFPIYRYAVMILIILMPLISIVALIDIIGEMTARKDEANLCVAFSTQELRNGCPILMNRKRKKNSNVTIREFYSDIPMKTWVERCEAIEDAMNCRIIENLYYGGKANGKIIVMVSVKGRIPVARGELYDDEL